MDARPRPDWTMADDPSSPGRPGAPTVPASMPPAVAAPASASRPDLNSRIERPMWQLQKGADRAEARAGIKFGRREFRVYVNGGLLWSRNYALDDTEFDVDAAAKRAEFVALGWGDPGDAPTPE
jgi:hypothetical protein